LISKSRHSGYWSDATYAFRLSSSISLNVLQLRRQNAAMIQSPPMTAAVESGTPVRNQSTIATRKMVRRAATEERTGEVREMSTRNEPENARPIG